MRPVRKKPESEPLAPDPFAELLKRREVNKVYYFHCDHFEPWGSGLNDKTIKGVENFQRQTLNSPYGAKLSLFYSVYVPHRLETNGNGSDDEVRRAPGDSVVFYRRSEKHDRMVTDVIRPLVTEASHEMHLHVHHEWWTRNDSHFDSPVSNWVNAHSTGELDQARLDLFFSLATSLIADETGASFERWAFVHGNWALAGSDPRICQIENELSMIMKYGGFGDFTFPAGRAICDPHLEVPFTCLPLDSKRAYDLPDSEPSPVARNAKVMKPDRFFIWNSKIKANYSSLDYYYAPNRDRFKQTDLMVENWLANSVVIENCLFVKTHAHSMYPYYNMSEPDSLIPHRYPDTVAIFDRLARACDRAAIELRFATVNEVMEHLHSIDGTTVPIAKKATRPAPRSAAPPPPEQPVIASPSSLEFEDSLAQALATLDRKAPPPDQGKLLSEAERAVFRHVMEDFKPDETAIVQGPPSGTGLALALAVAGFDVLSFQPDKPSLENLRSSMKALEPAARGLKDRLKPIAGAYPASFTVGATRPGKKRLLLALEVEADGATAREAQISSLPLFDDALVALGPLEIGLPGADESTLLARLATTNQLVKRVWSGDAEIWHLRPAHILGAGTAAATAARPVTVVSHSGTPLALDVSAFDRELVEMQRAWIAGEGKNYSADDAYSVKVERNAFLLTHERIIAEMIALSFPTASTHIVEIGSGCGGLALLLARHGFAVTGYEGDRRRFPVCQANLELQAATHPNLPKRLDYVQGFFPDVFTLGKRRTERRSVCLITNVTHSYTAQHQDLILRTASLFDELIVDLGRFGINRNTQGERSQLLAGLAASHYEPVELMYEQEPYEYWRLRARHPEREPAAAPAEPVRTPPPPVIEALEPEAASVPRREAPKIPDSFPLRSDQEVLFSIFGDRRVEHCPFCEGHDTLALWRIPMSQMADPISLFGGTFAHLPTRETPAPIFCYDFCQSCHTIFLNPMPATNKQRFHRDKYLVAKMARESEWRGYEEMFDKFAGAIPPGASIMLDAACGIGQYLRLAQKRSPGAWKRLIGLELSKPYVEDMRQHGIDAHVFDLDSDDAATVVGADQVDFVTFCEAFEQVERPLRVLHNLLKVLRPGGRLFFTAQRYGKDARGPVRPSEQIYLGPKGIEQLSLRLGCRVLDVSSSNMRYYVVLEK